MNQMLPPGPVMIDIEGTTVTAEELERLQHRAVGGLIFFRRNYESPEQIRDTINSIRAIRPGLLIAVDHEGGRVQRFRKGFTRLPPAACYETTGNDELAEKAGWLMAAELRSVDIDFSFAPVLDVESGISQVIGDRAFGSDPGTVSRLAGAWVRGMRRAGMAAVGKHFPGHGGVVEDSHLALPVDRRSMEELKARDLLPFQTLLNDGLAGIMPAHVIYDHIDPQPAGFSGYWLQNILRTQMGFTGAIFSDDLSMAGAAYAGSYADRARLALTAGCDMVLVCNAPGAAMEVLDALADLPPDISRQQRLEHMRGGFPIDRAQLLASTEWLKIAGRITDLAEQWA